MRTAPSLTAEKREAICKYLRKGLPRRRAAAMASVSEGTFLEWLRAASRPDASEELKLLADQVELAEAECQLSWLEPCADEIPKNAKIALNMLSKRFPDEWGRRDNVSPVSVEDREAETKSLRATLLERLERLIPSSSTFAGTVEEAPVLPPASEPVQLGAPSE